jgi:hypothetical protein
MENAYKILLRRTRNRRDDIRMNLKEIGWEGVDWIWLRIWTMAGYCERRYMGTILPLL